MAGFMDAERVTSLTQMVTVAILLAASGVFVAVKRLQQFSWPVWVVFVGALTYPLYLTHNIGKRIFITGPAAEYFGPARHLVAIALSLLLAWPVMPAAERFVKPGLKRVLDGMGIRGSVRQRSLAHERDNAAEASQPPGSLRQSPTAFACLPAICAFGRLKKNFAPTLGAASAQTVPPYRFTIRCTVARPRPTPRNSSMECSRRNG